MVMLDLRGSSSSRFQLPNPIADELLSKAERYDGLALYETVSGLNFGTFRLKYNKKSVTVKNSDLEEFRKLRGIREDDEVLLYVDRIHNTFNFSFELRRKDDNGVHVVVRKEPPEPLPLQLEEIFKKMIRENLESQKKALSEEFVARRTEEMLVQTRIRVRRSIAEFVEAHPPPPGTTEPPLLLPEFRSCLG